MSISWSRDAYGTPHSLIRDRCKALGLPTWRCDRTGVIIDEPIETGLSGLWLRSGPVSRFVSHAAHVWGDQDKPEVVEPIPSCWLVPLPEERHQHRHAFTIAMALDPSGLESPEFLDICAHANLDATAVQKSFNDLTRFRPDASHWVGSLLGWTLRDLTALRQSEQMIDGFTKQLTDSYETIDLLYTLGRSMQDLTQPDKFVSLVCNRIHITMGFTWIAAYFVRSSRIGRHMRKTLHVHGRAPASEGDIARAAVDLIARAPDRIGTFVAGEADGLNLAPGAQLLVQPIVREGEIVGVFIVGDKRGDDPHVSSYDMQLIETAAGYVAAFLENASLYADQQAMFIGSLRALSTAIDAKDRYTQGHSERVALMGARLAEAVNLDPSQVERLHICGLVHDVGKIGVPEHILCKNGRLTEDEFAMIKKHPEIGESIVSQIPLLKDVLPGVLHHHERWDGNGYPHGLAGLDIPLFGRLLALADTFDAMSSTRSYRPAMPRARVLEEITRCAGSQFDPDLAKVFVTLDLSDYDRMAREHQRIADAGQGDAAVARPAA